MVSASYGRQHGPDVCPHASTSNRNCHAAESLSIVTRLCGGKPRCIIKANGDTFGDPCAGTYKYLTANYLCIAGKPPPPPPKATCFGKCGMFFEAFSYPRYPRGQTLKDWEATVHDDIWNDWEPRVSHPALANEVWYQSDSDFVRDIPSFRSSDFYVMRFRGSFSATANGRYSFQLRSDDGSRLYINRKMVVDNDGFHGATTKSGSIALTKGWWKIMSVFFENGGGSTLQTSVRFPGEEKFVRLSHTHTTPFESESDQGCKPGEDSTHECGRQCGDGKDNDSDSLVDCDDPDCADICGDKQDDPKQLRSPANACFNNCDYPGCGVKGVLKSWCHTGKCLMGMPDARCKLRANGYRLGDGWWCNDGRRDSYCTAREFGKQCFDGIDNGVPLTHLLVLPPSPTMTE